MYRLVPFLMSTARLPSRPEEEANRAPCYEGERKKSQNILLVSECLMRPGPPRMRGGVQDLEEILECVISWDAARSSFCKGRQIWWCKNVYQRNLWQSPCPEINLGASERPAHEITRVQFINDLLVLGNGSLSLIHALFPSLDTSSLLPCQSFRLHFWDGCCYYSESIF